MDSVFQQAITKFEARLTEEQRLQLAGCSRDDVEKTIADIQARWGSQRRLRNMNRLSKFLEAMAQLGHVVEVFLNVDSTVAMIWGPIKFLLLIASTWLNGLEKLLETYAEIGEVLPPLKQYQSLFKNHRFVLSYLESYYCDILEFHTIAFEVFARPVWKEIFRSAWKTFETRFGSVLASMRRHKALLSEEKLTAIQAEIQDFRGNFEDRFAAFARELKDRDDAQGAHSAEKENTSRQRKIATILDKLDPPEYLIDQEYAMEQWQSSNSGAWVLKDPCFQEWLKPAAKSVLYLNGIPGAGKSVLVSRIIKYLQQAQVDFTNNNEKRNQPQIAGFSLVYFYFKHQEPRKRQLSDLLAAITAQLIQQDDSIVDHVFNEYCTGDQSKLRSSISLLKLVQMLVRTQQSCTFVLDGLDECTGSSTKATSDECEKILDAVFSLFPPDASGAEMDGSPRIFRLTSSTQRRFRLLVSGQRDGILDHKFEEYPAIRLEKSSAHSDDIDAYANAIIKKIAERFSIKQDTGSLIFHGVHNESKGMFLYAKIVLNNLLHQVSRSGLKRELHTKSFPKGLHEAYERVVASVFDNPKLAERDAAVRIMKLVAVAERPLRWREIQTKFCVDVERETSDPDERIEISCKALCRSLVDVVGLGGARNNANDTIHIVHSTALDFLIQTGRIDLHIEHARMAMFCGQYLGSCCLRRNSNLATLAEAVQMGYLGLHDYALAFWFDHFAHAIDDICVLPEMDQDGVKMAALKLENAFSRHTNNLLGPEIAISDMGIQWLQGLHRDHRDRFLSLPAIASMIDSIRTAIETSRSAESDVQGQIGLDTLYGPPTFKCSKPWCEFYFTGFVNRTQRKRHVQEHDMPFRCEEESCYAYLFGFPTEEKLDRHMQIAHYENLRPPSKRVKVFPVTPSSALVVGDLCSAAADGNLALVQALIKKGVDLNAPSKAYAHRFPLNIAAKQGHLHVCKLLLESGADANRASLQGQCTPLIIASQQGDMDMVSLLLYKRDLNIWRRDRGEWSALGYAVLMGHTATVHVFIKRLGKKDLYLNAAGPSKATGLAIAIREGKREIVELFLDNLPNGIYPQRLCGDDKHPLHSALKRGDEWLALMMVQTTFGKVVWDFNEKDFQGMLPLHAAIIGGCTRMTTFLLRNTYSVDARDSEGLSPFHYAIEAGDHTTMSFLLDKHPLIDLAITNAAGQCCVMSSIGKVSRSLVHRMLKLNPLCLTGHDVVGASLLHYLCYDGDLEGVQLLLAVCQLDVNATMSSWPAHWEAHWPRPEGSFGLNPITCTMVGSKAGDSRREILRMLVETEKLKFTGDNHMQLLQVCSSADDGLLLWRLIHQGLRSLSAPTGKLILASPSLGEMVSCLLRDQLVAKRAIQMDSALVEKTLRDCFECLVDYEPSNAASIFSESERLFPELTAVARERLSQNHLASIREERLVKASVDNDMTTLQSLVYEGLTLADVVRCGDESVLEWGLATGRFDVNEVNNGRTLFVDTCLDYRWPVVNLMLKHGVVQPRKITKVIDMLSSVQSDEAIKGVSILKQYLQDLFINI